MPGFGRWDELGDRLAGWTIASRRNVIISVGIAHGILIAGSWLIAWLLATPDTWDVDHSPMLHHSVWVVFCWTLGLMLMWFYAPVVKEIVKVSWKAWRERD